MIGRRNTLAGLMGTAFTVAAARPAFAANAPAKLGGRSNYRIATQQSCGDLVHASVTIDVTEDIVCKPTNAENGFNFQMNCFSNQARSAWQQYIVGLAGTDLHGKFQNFRSVGPDKPMKTMAKPQFPLLSLPGLTLPAGFQITIQLINDASHNVIGVDFTIAKRGSTVAQKRVTLTDNGIDPANLAPIVAFELVLVGPAGGHTAVLKAGGGMFAYSAAGPMVAGADLPACVAHANGTAEQSNSTYGRIPANPGASFSQTFGVS